jgi:hypothetical protein
MSSERGTDTFFVIFTGLPPFPWRRPRLWAVWVVMALASLRSRDRICHISVSNGRDAVSLGCMCYPDVWHEHLAILRHPHMRSVVMLRKPANNCRHREYDYDSYRLPAGYTCVSASRGHIALCGIQTSWCLTPAGLYEQLKRRTDVKVLVHDSIRPRSAGEAGD